MYLSAISYCYSVKQQSFYKMAVAAEPSNELDSSEGVRLRQFLSQMQHLMQYARCKLSDTVR